MVVMIGNTVGWFAKSRDLEREGIGLGECERMRRCVVNMKDEVCGNGVSILNS